MCCHIVLFLFSYVRGNHSLFFFLVTKLQFNEHRVFGACRVSRKTDMNEMDKKKNRDLGLGLLHALWNLLK